MTEEEWADEDDVDYLLDFLIQEVGASDRKLRLFACACCRRIEVHADDFLEKLLARAEQFADGVVTGDGLAAGHDAARQRFGTLSRHEDPHLEAHQTAREAFILSAETSLDPTDADRNPNIHYAREASGMAAVTMELQHRRHAALSEESAEQIKLIHDIFGNPLNPASLDASWLTATVVDLASAAYEERLLPGSELDRERLAVLSDALEEAGCTNAAILDHLRGPGPHVRGCHVLDLLLGKQ